MNNQSSEINNLQNAQANNEKELILLKNRIYSRTENAEATSSK